MSVSKQNRILIWRREVASALDDAASSAVSTTSSSSTVTTSTTPASANGLPPASAAVNADSPTSSFSSASSRRRALWNRLSRRLAIHHGPESPATPVESPRTAMYRDNPPDAALEGLTVVDSAPDRPEGEAQAQAQPSPNREAEVQEELPLGEESSSDGGGRGLRERQERLQRAARLLQHGPKKDERAPAVSVRT